MTALTLPPVRYAEIPNGLINPNPRNIRLDGVGDITELAASIAEVGVLEPLVVAPVLDADAPRRCQTCDREYPAQELDAMGDIPRHWRTEAGRKTCPGAGFQPAPVTPVGYDLIAGHRRLAAAIKAGRPTVPCIVRADITGAVDVTVAMLAENLHRQSLTPIEEATAYLQLELAGLKTGEVARRTGRSRATVKARRQLMDLPDGTRAKIQARQITLDEASAMVEFINDPARLKDLEAAAGTRDFGYALSRARISQKTEADRAALLAGLEAQGIPVLRTEDTHKIPRQSAAFLMVSEDDHAACPGRAVWVNHNASFTSDYCLQPWLHRPDLFTAPTASTLDDDDAADDDDGPAAEPASPQTVVREALDQAAAADQANREEIRARREEQERDMRAANEVRRIWVEAYLKARTPLKPEAHATILREVNTILVDAYLGEPGPDAWLANLGEPSDPDVEGVDVDDWQRDRLRALTTSMDPARMMLAYIVAEQETYLDHDYAWTGHAQGDTARYITMLAALGYEPCTWEAERVAATLAKKAAEAAARAAAAPPEEPRPVEAIDLPDDAA